MYQPRREDWLRSPARLTLDMKHILNISIKVFMLTGRLSLKLLLEKKEANKTGNIIFVMIPNKEGCV